MHGKVICVVWLGLATGLAVGSGGADLQAMEPAGGREVGQSSPMVDEAGEAVYGHGLSREEALEGWISLFDGETTFGIVDGECRDGVLTGGRTSSSFRNYEIRADVVVGGPLGVGAETALVAPGRWTKRVEHFRGPIRLGPKTSVGHLAIRPLGLEHLFNGRNLGGWARRERVELAEERRARWEVEDSVLRVVGGPGALEYVGLTPTRLLGDFVVQVDVRTRAAHTNSGLFFRAIPGEVMNGYEAQVHNWDPNNPRGYATGAIDDRQAARRLVSCDGELFRMTVVAVGPHIAVWVNGYQTADWTDTRAADENPRKGLRTEPGTLQLQAHDAGTDVEFHRVLAADW